MRSACQGGCFEGRAAARNHPEFRGLLCPSGFGGVLGPCSCPVISCAGCGGGGPAWGFVKQEGGCWEKSAPCAWGLVSMERV